MKIEADIWLAAAHICDEAVESTRLTADSDQITTGLEAAACLGAIQQAGKLATIFRQRAQEAKCTPK